jgi:hypothetical protein
MTFRFYGYIFSQTFSGFGILNILLSPYFNKFSDTYFYSFSIEVVVGLF